MFPGSRGEDCGLGALVWEGAVGPELEQRGAGLQDVLPGEPGTGCRPGRCRVPASSLATLVHYPEAGVGLGGRKALCCPPASPLRPVALPRSEGLGPTPAPSSCPLTVLSLFLGLYPTPCTTCLSRTPCCLFLCEDYRTLAADPEEGRSARTVQSRESPRGVAVRSCSGSCAQKRLRSRQVGRAVPCSPPPSPGLCFVPSCPQIGKDGL